MSNAKHRHETLMKARNYDLKAWPAYGFFAYEFSDAFIDVDDITNNLITQNAKKNIADITEK